MSKISIKDWHLCYPDGVKHETRDGKEVIVVTIQKYLEYQRYDHEAPATREFVIPGDTKDVLAAANAAVQIARQLH